MGQCASKNLRRKRSRWKSSEFLSETTGHSDDTGLSSANRSQSESSMTADRRRSRPGGGPQGGGFSRRRSTRGSIRYSRQQQKQIQDRFSDGTSCGSEEEERLLNSLCQDQIVVHNVVRKMGCEKFDVELDSEQPKPLGKKPRLPSQRKASMMAKKKAVEAAVPKTPKIAKPPKASGKVPVKTAVTPTKVVANKSRPKPNSWRKGKTVKNPGRPTMKDN